MLEYCKKHKEHHKGICQKCNPFYLPLLRDALIKFTNECVTLAYEYEKKSINTNG